MEEDEHEDESHPDDDDDDPFSSEITTAARVAPRNGVSAGGSSSSAYQRAEQMLNSSSADESEQADEEEEEERGEDMDDYRATAQPASQSHGRGQFRSSALRDEQFDVEDGEMQEEELDGDSDRFSGRNSDMHGSGRSSGREHGHSAHSTGRAGSIAQHPPSRSRLQERGQLRQWSQTAMQLKQR